MDLLNAIRAASSGKATGPDACGSEFYKSFQEKIVPLMLRMLNDSLKNKRLPSSLYEANIGLVLKRDREDFDPSSCRPISRKSS